MHRIELSAVEKRFHERTAVKKTDLCLESGVYGLLGENGAGKTTLMRMICGVLKPTGGASAVMALRSAGWEEHTAGCLDTCPRDFGLLRRVFCPAVPALYGGSEGDAAGLRRAPYR